MAGDRRCEDKGGLTKGLWSSRCSEARACFSCWTANCAALFSANALARDVVAAEEL